MKTFKVVTILKQQEDQENLTLTILTKLTKSSSKNKLILSKNIYPKNNRQKNKISIKNLIFQNLFI